MAEPTIEGDANTPEDTRPEAPSWHRASSQSNWDRCRDAVGNASAELGAMGTVLLPAITANLATDALKEIFKLVVASLSFGTTLEPGGRRTGSIREEHLEVQRMLAILSIQSAIICGLQDNGLTPEDLLRDDKLLAELRAQMQVPESSTLPARVLISIDRSALARAVRDWEFPPGGDRRI